jgi:hypothetical protein
MGRGKHSKNKGGSSSQVGNSGSRGGGSSTLLLDRNLVPRLEEYALNHDVSDVDDVVDHLRRSYKEYQRKQVAALRQMVTRALQVVQQRGVAKPELQIQVGGLYMINNPVLVCADVLGHCAWGQGGRAGTAAGASACCSNSNSNSSCNK